MHSMLHFGFDAMFAACIFPIRPSPNKAIFSFLIGVIFIKKNNFKKAIIRIANGIGYLFGLTNIIIERYKY